MTDRYAQSPKLSQYSFPIVAIIKFDASLVNDRGNILAQESEMGDAELQTTRVDAGEKSDESTYLT